MWSSPTLSHRAKSAEKILRKDRYCHNQSRNVFSTGQILLKINIEEKQVVTKSIENSFLIDPVNTNIAI